MRNTVCTISFYFLFFIFCIGCLGKSVIDPIDDKFPSLDHDLSFIPFNKALDNADFMICDSSRFHSGRNGIQYVDGSNKLRKDITTNYSYHKAYESFNGFIVIRFLVNCKGKTGRYRAQSLNLDFSPAKAPADLIEHSLDLIKDLDNWKKHPAVDSKKEFSKYINLKIKNGKIEHVLL